VRFIVADNIKMSLKVNQRDLLQAALLYLITTPTGNVCAKFPCSKTDNLFMLQDRKTDHRQHAGIHYDSLHINV